MIFVGKIRIDNPMFVLPHFLWNFIIYEILKFGNCLEQGSQTRLSKSAGPLVSMVAESFVSENSYTTSWSLRVLQIKWRDPALKNKIHPSRHYVCSFSVGHHEDGLSPRESQIRERDRGGGRGGGGKEVEGGQREREGGSMSVPTGQNYFNNSHVSHVHIADSLQRTFPHW